MKFCTNGTENAQVQTCILTGPFFKKNLWRKRLEKEELSDFTALNECLERWKQIYEVTEKRLCGAADEVSTTSVQTITRVVPGL